MSDLLARLDQAIMDEMRRYSPNDNVVEIAKVLRELIVSLDDVKITVMECR